MTEEIITGIFTILGVLVGAFASHRSEIKKSKRELRIRAFVKIVSTKLPLIQAIQTNIEALLLTEYYEARAYMSGSQIDLEEAKSQNARMLSLIPEVTKQRSVFAEALAEVKISFDIDSETNQILHDVYKGQSLSIQSVVNKYKTEQELDKWKDRCLESIHNHLKENYTDKIEKIVEKLYPEFTKL